QEHARLRRVHILLEVQKRPVRRGQRGVLVDRQLAVADGHAIDPEGGTGVGQPRTRNKLIGRGQVAQDGVVGDARQWLAERPQGGARPVANRNHDVGMGLVGLIEHCPPGGGARPAARQTSRSRSREKVVHFMLRCEIISRGRTGDRSMATLTIASKNYGSWSLRGWLLCKMAGLEVEGRQAPGDDPSTRAGPALLSPALLGPRLTPTRVTGWGPLPLPRYLKQVEAD